MNELRNYRYYDPIDICQAYFQNREDSHLIVGFGFVIDDVNR